MAVVRRLTPRIVGLLLLLGAGVGVGCEVHSAARRSVYRAAASIEAEDATTVAVRTRSGSVAVSPAAGERIEIDLEVWLRESRPETDAVKSIDAHLAQSRSGGVLELLDRHRGANDAEDWELRLTVRVPERMAVRVEQTVGTVRVEMAPRSDAEVEVSVATGHVEVVGSADYRGEVDVAVKTGSIELPDDWKLVAERRLASARVLGRVGEGGRRLRVELSTGSVSIR
ncbi:MAG: hypothetical protein AB7I19_08960 [Planctomycetota bacterium]